MPNPPIARRCPSCGASVRRRSLFCPHCGNSLEAHAKEKVANDSMTETVIERASDMPTQPLSEPRPIASEKPVEPAPVVASPQPQPRPAEKRPSPEARKRVQDPARSNEIGSLQRVQKIRKISTVVLDEAAHDPSLRFIVVAAALFVVFLTILIMSKLIN